MRARRLKALALKESVTALRVAESLLARSSIGFVSSYSEQEKQHWNNRLLSASNLEVPLLTLSGLTSLNVANDVAAMECDRGPLEGRQDAAADDDDDDIEIQLEVAVAVQKYVQSQRLVAIAVEQVGDQSPASIKSTLHNCKGGLGQTGEPCYNHRIRISFELADQAMKILSASRGTSHNCTDPKGLNTAPTAAAKSSPGPVLLSKAFSFIFSLLQSDSTGTVLLLEGRHGDDCDEKEGHPTSTAVKDFFKFCDVFEKVWILPKSILFEQNSAFSSSSGGHCGRSGTCAGDGVYVSNSNRDDRKHNDKSLYQGEEAEGKVDRDIELLSFLLLSSIPPHRKRMKSKRHKRRFLESRQIREGKEAVLLALKYYTKKSEATHTIARRARDRILSISTALKLAVIAAKQADFYSQDSLARVAFNDVSNTDVITGCCVDINSSSHADMSCRENVFSEARQGIKSNVSNLTQQLGDWEAVLELSHLALSVLWGQAVHAALSSPCLMAEVARSVLLGGMHRLSGSDPSSIYLSPEISLSFLQYWMACTSGKQKSTQITPDGCSLSQPSLVTMSKKDMNSPAYSWQCISTHISNTRRSQLDPSNTFPAHLSGSRTALVVAVHTYILASSSHIGADFYPSCRMQKAMLVCGAWELLMPLCCNASSWRDKDEMQNEAFRGLQLMSLSLASRACKLWIGAEKHVVPLFVSTAASLLTMRKQSNLCTRSDRGIGMGSAAPGKLFPSQLEISTGDESDYEVLAWGVQHGTLADVNERGQNRGIVEASDNVKWCAGPLHSLATDAHASIDVLSLSLDITKQAALSCSSRRYGSGYLHARSSLHDVMTQLSSCVFSALNLQSPLLDPIISATPDTCEDSKSASALLQLFFASGIPQEHVAASTVFYLVRLLRRMLVNTVATGERKEASALHTRLHTSCNANLANLLDMPRMAAIAPCSSRSTRVGNQSSVSFSLTEGVCLCMAIRVVAETVPQGESLFRYAVLSISPLCQH